MIPNLPITQLMPSSPEQLEAMKSPEQLEAEELERVEEERIQDERERKLQDIWVKRIKAEQKDHKDFRTRGKDIAKVLKDGETQNTQSGLYVPLFWSVLQVEHSGVYSSQPTPDVRPNNNNNQQLYNDAAQILERGIGYFTDQQSFDNNFHRTVDDFLGQGLGVIRVKLDSVIFEENGEEMLGNQNLRWEYVPWKRFGWEPCNSWDDCDWEYFAHRMTNAQILKQFDREVSSGKDETSDDKVNTDKWKNKTQTVYEIWDKPNKKIVFLAMNESTPLEILDDVLGLQGFYPNPPPMFTNLDTEELVPKSDYDYIEAFDVEINDMQDRRMALLTQLRASGAYDKSLPELADLLDLDDGEMKPIANLIARLQGASLENTVIFLPLEEKIRVIGELTEQIAMRTAQVEAILGIADIVRGVSNAAEGVGTQELKGRWVGIRLSRKRDTVQYTVREMFRIMGQLIASHFTPENLVRLTQQQPEPQVIELLKNDLMMDFSLDIETESTVAKDEFQERSSRQEMLQGITAFSQGVLPAVQAGQMPAGVSSAVLRAALQPYTKFDKSLDQELAGLEDNQQQLGKMNQQIQQLTQQLQQITQQSQEWQKIATSLQYAATEAKAKDLTASAGKKQAETQEIYEEIGSERREQPLENAKTVSEIGLNRAKTVNTLRPPTQGRPN